MANNKLVEYINSPLIKNTLKLSSSSAFLMFLPLVVTPILSRLYSPEEYAVWGIFSSVLSIVGSFMFFSYENAIIRSNEENEITPLVSLCILLSFLVSIVIGAFYFIGRSLNIDFFLDLPPAVCFLLAIISYSAFTLFSCVANRKELYGRMSIANIINGVGQAGFRILLGVFPVISFGLVYGNMFAYIVADCYLLYIIYHINRKTIKWPSISEIKQIAKKYSRFPKFDAPARIIELTAGNIVIIILSFFFGKEDLGCFSMVVQLILLPITVIGSAMANVYYRDISKNIDNIGEISQTTIKVERISLILSFLPILFLVMGGDQLLVKYLGSRWNNVGIMSLCLAIYSLPVIMTEPLLPAFRALDKQDVRLKFNIVNLFLSLCSLLLFSYFINDIYVVIIIYSCLYSAIRFGMLLYIYRITNISLMRVSKYALLGVLFTYSILVAKILAHFHII